MLSVVSLLVISAVWPPPYSWDRLSTFTFPGCTPGRYFTESEMTGYANYTMTTYWGINVTCQPGGIHTKGNTFICDDAAGQFVGNQEITLPEQGEMLQQSGSRYVMPYMYWGCTQDSYAKAQEFNTHTKWIARNSSGQLLECKKFQGLEHFGINFTLEAAQEFYVDQMVAPLLHANSTSGMFFDAFGLTALSYIQDDTPQQQQQMADAILSTLSRVLSAFKAAGKVAIISIKSEYPDDFIDRYMDIMSQYKPHGMYYGEFFCTKNCTADIIVYKKALAKGIPIQQHVPIGSASEFNFRLAAYLTYVEEQCYVGAGYPGDWGPDGFPWLPEFEKPLGKPLGPPSQTGPHTFTREFEHVSVSVDFNTSTGNIVWG